MLVLPGSESLIRMNAESLEQQSSPGQRGDSGSGNSALASAKQKAGMNQVKVFDSTQDFYDLSDPKRLSAWSNLDSEEKAGFVRMVAELAKRGLVGYEILDVQDKPYKSFVTPQIADQEASSAHIYDRNGSFKRLP